MKNSKSWPPEDFEIAAKMWRAGKSGGQIGRVIGKSRGSVIGMMGRNGVKTPAPPKKRGYATISKPEPPRIAVTSPAQRDRAPRRFVFGNGPKTNQIKPPTPAAAALPSAPTPLNVSYADLDDGMCHWPTDGGYCGTETARGRKYCPYHEQAKTATGMRALKAAAAELSMSAQ